MNNVDKQYISLLKDILENGKIKQTRAGETLSVFGRTMRFNLKEGLPLLTTKKVFYRGCIEELLWFLQGNTNIKYLIEKNIHIWTDDAYRWYKTLLNNHNQMVEKRKEREKFVLTPQLPKYREYTKQEFLDQVFNQTPLVFYGEIYNHIINYTCGDLGDVYGKQWRKYGKSGRDQIKDIISTLKTNPDDRRMLCIAFNPDVLEKVALPPCHIMFQFYTRELSVSERWEWLKKKNDTDEIKYLETLTKNKEESIGCLNEHNVPKRELSCSFTMRSNDFCCGNPFNILQYGLLTYMIAEVTNMAVGELIYNGGDIHVYTNHIEQAKEQINREGSDVIPTLKFKRKIGDINDFKYEDFIIENYQPSLPIKYPLNVG